MNNYYIYFTMEEIIGSIIILSIIFICIVVKQNKNKQQNTFEKTDKELSNIQKGIAGEDVIEEKLHKIDIYHKIIRNVYIYNGNKKTEIDIIYITICGLFIIESKNFKGAIYGSDYKKEWLQYLNTNKKYRFDNPIYQNNYHINFLCDKLKLTNKNHIHSYIVFGDNAKINQIDYSHSNNLKVINTKDIIENIIEDIHNFPIVLSHEEIDKLYIDLQFYCSHLNR